MKKFLIVAVLAAVLPFAACDLVTGADPSPRVRFFNATTGMTGSGGFTTNGQFASALGFAQSSQSCAKVDAGSASFGFGIANTAGTGLSGSALAALNNQSITEGGRYTMVAAGSATSPQLYLLDNSYSGSLAGDQAAVRFVNLAPGPNPVPYVFYVFTSWPPVEGSLFEANLLVGSPTAFKKVASGTTPFWTIVGHEMATLSNASVNLQAGKVNTIAIVPNSTSTGFQLINIPSC